MRDMKATQSERCNQRQGDSICQEISARKDNDIQGNGISPKYNAMKCQLQSMSSTLLQIVNYNPKFI